MGRLNEECHGLRDDLKRQQALVNQKKGVNAELRGRGVHLMGLRVACFSAQGF